MGHDELSRIFEKGNSFGEGTETLRIMGGVVNCEGLSRISFSNTLSQGAAHFCIHYSNTCRLLFVNTEKFEKKWYGLFKDSAQVKEVDCDFLWFIVSEEKTA